jgi:hypothetical protein
LEWDLGALAFLPLMGETGKVKNGLVVNQGGAGDKRALGPDVLAQPKGWIILPWGVSDIEEFGKIHGLTRKKLGEVLGGLTVSTIFKWEMGVRSPGKMGKVLLSKIDEELKMKGGEKKCGNDKRKKTG